MVGIGFSLGAQLLMKYLGESKEHQEKFSVAASICQGYDLGEYVDKIVELYQLKIDKLEAKIEDFQFQEENVKIKEK